MPVGSPRMRAGVLYRRALAKQVLLDYLPSETTPIGRKELAKSAIRDAKFALTLLEQNRGARREDCVNRALMVWVSLVHRHCRTELGPAKYEKLLEKEKVIERLWVSLRKMPRGHPRAEVTASNLTNLCSVCRRFDTREAYIYLAAIDERYGNLKHKAPTALHSLEMDPDCTHLRAVLEANPVTRKEIEECKQSLS
jgi:hypothetical protein